MWPCHTVPLLVGITMIQNILISGRLCVLYLVRSKVWALTLNQPVAVDHVYGYLMQELLLDSTHRSA